MQIISDHRGIVLVFGSRGDLARTINNLTKLFERVVEKDTNAPHLYSFFHEDVGKDVIRELLDEIKPESKETRFSEIKHE